MMFANGYIAAAFIIGAVILLSMTAYAVVKLRRAQRRLATAEFKGRGR
jgi:uncharacterized integral membrane protein